MIVKGIIKSIDFNGNSCTVRMPYFETAGSAEVVSEALISNVPGIYNGYKENDVVWVAFDNGKMDEPVVIGKLYLGAAKEKNDPRGTINCETQNVSKTASIPFDTKLGTNLGDKQINTKAPFGSLESLASNLNRVDTEQGQNNRDLGNRLRSVVDAIGPDGEIVYSVIEQTADKISNEVVHKSSKTEPGYDYTKKMGWELNLNGWDVYSEYETLMALENNITLSIQKSLTSDTNTIFINNTDTTITPQEMCGEIILEFIKKPGYCEISSGKGGTGRWEDKSDPEHPITYYSYESKATREDPDTGDVIPAEYKCLEMSEFLETFLGQAYTKYLTDLTYEDSQSIGKATRTPEPLQYREYYINYDGSGDPINKGWCVFFDTSEIGHELTFKIVYYESQDTPSTTVKPIIVKLNAILLFNGESEESIDPTNRKWSLVSYYKINSSTQTRFAPVKLLRTPISDKTNTLVGINRNGLYVNGTVAAKRGHIGEFIIGGTHTCEALSNDTASGIYSRNYIKRFEDQPTKDQIGVYVGTDGIKIGDKFSVSADGKVRGSGFEITLDTTAQKELQIVNKNYQDGNTKLEDIYANEKSAPGHAISALSSADKGVSSAHTVSYNLDLGNKVSPETMEYSLLCPSANIYSLLAMPLLLKNSGTLFTSEDNYIPWTISFKVKKADTINHSAGIPAVNSSKKLFVFLGTLENSNTNFKFDTLPARYYTFKNFSSCNTYTAVRDEGGVTTDINTPTIDAGTKRFRVYLNYNKQHGEITYEDNPLNPAGSEKRYSDYIKNYPTGVNDDIYIWGYNEDNEWARIPLTTYLQSKGYTISSSDGPQTVGTSRSFSSCNTEYESYYSAYLLAEVTQESSVVYETEDPNYSIVAITLDRRYYNVYNSLKDNLRLGICYFDPDNSEVPLLVKEFKFEKSKIYSDYTISDYDAYATASNSKTITVDNMTLQKYNSYVQGQLGNFAKTQVQREAYHIVKNDVIIVQGTLEEQGQTSMYTICFIEAGNSGDLGGIIQFKYKSAATSSVTISTKTKYRGTVAKVAPSIAEEERQYWSDNFVEPNGTDAKYIWSSLITTRTESGQSSTDTWGQPTLAATYDGLLSILSTEDVDLVEVDTSVTPNVYYLRGDVITGALGNKVKIGGDQGFTIKPSQEVTNNGQTTYTPAAIYNTIDHFDTSKDDPAHPYTQGGVYVGQDGIRLGNTFLVDKQGNVTATSLTVQQSQVSGLAGALDNAATTGANSAVSTIDGRGYQTASQVTTITENTIQTGNLVAQNLHVKAANIDGSVTAKKIEVKSGSDTVLLADADDPSSTYIGGFNVATNYLSTGPNSITDTTKSGLCLTSNGIGFTELKNSSGYLSTQLTTQLSDRSQWGSILKITDKPLQETSATYACELKGSLQGDEIKIGRYYFDDEFGSNIVGSKLGIFHTSDPWFGSNVAGYEMKVINGCNIPRKYRSKNGTITNLQIGVACYDTYDDTFDEGFVRTDDYYYDVSIEMRNYWNESKYSTGTGQLHGTWTGTLGSGSDKYLKKNIEDLSNKYDIFFDNLNPVRFKYKDGTSNRYHTGLIAQEVATAIQKAQLTEQEVAAIISIPTDKREQELLSKDPEIDKVPDQLYAIRYTELVSLNIDQIQKLKKRVAELEEKLNKIEKGE